LKSPKSFQELPQPQEAELPKERRHLFFEGVSLFLKGLEKLFCGQEANLCLSLSQPAVSGQPAGTRIKSVIPAEAGIHFFSTHLYMKEYFYVYILSSEKRGTLYVGVTSNLLKRVYEHKNGVAEGFTREK